MSVKTNAHYFPLVELVRYSESKHGWRMIQHESISSDKPAGVDAGAEE